jgi:hypothetical protein
MIKINPPATKFVPFTVEITFETDLQLAAFINLYSDPDFYGRMIQTGNFWTKIDISPNDMVTGVDSLLTLDDINALHKLL